MEIIDNYLDYRKNKPQYKTWKQKCLENEAKRLAYIEKNKIPENQKETDIKRAKAILNAVDVMDEYSQSRAESMEIYTETVKSAIYNIISPISMGIGFLTFLITGKKATPKGLIAPIISMLASAIIPSILLSQWGAKKEVQASRKGRLEAMQKDLSSVKQFAILTKEQEEQRDKIAKTITLTAKENKKNVPNAHLKLSEAIKTLLLEDEDLLKAQKQFKQEEKEQKSNFDKELTAQEIEEAKKDKQLITNVIEKIDIASQDYAENLELLTMSLSTAALAGGGLVGFITNKILSLTKINSDKKSIVSIATGTIVTIAVSIIAANIQKQGSRIARFKVKQDFLKNPEKLIYVDDEKAKNEDGTKFLNKNKKEGFFKFISNVFKYNKEYNNYIKNNNHIIQKQRKAQDKIELTPQQEKRAKQLQQNIFKSFNKLDEKSQTYSESTEALGETITMFASALMTIPLIFGLNKSIKKITNLPDNASKEKMMSAFSKTMFSIIKYTVLSVLPIQTLYVLITKEQKSASRVADMLAIKEMDDYRNFADYSSNKVQSETLSPTKSIENLFFMRTHQG